MNDDVISLGFPYIASCEEVIAGFSPVLLHLIRFSHAFWVFRFTRYRTFSPRFTRFHPFCKKSALLPKFTEFNHVSFVSRFNETKHSGVMENDVIFIKLS